jgi:hypothetical protein
MSLEVIIQNSITTRKQSGNLVFLAVVTKKNMKIFSSYNGILVAMSLSEKNRGREYCAIFSP